ncbi:MAG: M81 family metallopeptidase [Clostridia bacterium]|nr:M81 family metallopeptidase [Clostridia bacterium]
MKKKQIFVLEFQQESNTFNPVVATEKSFLPKEKENCLNNRIKVGGCLAGAASVFAEAGAELIPSFFAAAPSGGRVSDAFFNHVCERVKYHLQNAGEIDGVYATLHGATCTETVDDACGTLMEMVRELVGNKPIAASFDLHANITEKMLRSVDIICGYNTYPHVDYYTTGKRAATLLMEMLAGKTHIKATADVLVPPAGYTSLEGAFKELMDMGQAMVEAGEIRDFTLFPVQPWLDLSEITSRVVTYGDDADKAKACADKLIQGLVERKERMHPKMYSVEEIIKIAEENTSGKPVILADSADSPNGGAVGDSPAVALKLQELGSNLRTSVLVVDPQAVERAFEVGVGNSGKFSIGAHSTPGLTEPFKGEGTVVSLHNGEFLMYRHGEATLGRSAVVRFGNLYILLCTRGSNTGKPTMYRAFGLEPTAFDLLVIKANTSFRVPYAPITDLIYVSDTPGAGASNLKLFQWDHLPAGFYPFDLPENYTPAPAKLW